MAFAKQKLQEVFILAKAIEAREGIGKELAASDALVSSRKNSSRIHKPELANRMAAGNGRNDPPQKPVSAASRNSSRGVVASHTTNHHNRFFASDS